MKGSCTEPKSPVNGRSGAGGSVTEGLSSYGGRGLRENFLLKSL